MAQPAFEEIVEDFEFLEDWEDRYRYVNDRGKAGDVVGVDAPRELARLGLNDHLSAQRSNGLRAMIERIRLVASQAD